MEIFDTLAGAVTLTAILSILIAAFFIWLGAKVAQVGSKATFGRAILAAIGVALVTWLVAWLLSYFPQVSPFVGFVST